MADFFTSTSTSTFVAPVDKAVVQTTQQTKAQNASDMTTQSTKTSGSNFSMCEIIM
ncbi:hypothetical protein RSOL_249250 [Rhizoctonia solani AG-3 Rhs1AP]|uniref:Uncharacterized protein n=1 Tax=Rhizoctonia solani AG-3 Rhs1AP TaxID=1086054 RepID=A0A0A1UIY3_9AGAM|nr:hypothetical protein RSOL_249250 [Rhizoctonia solani AG-3 Rhs1AP]